MERIGMDLPGDGKLLYVSSYDVSEPNGPGVNEREFMTSLLERFGERVIAVVPQPRRACPELRAAQTVLYANPRIGRMLGAAAQQFDLAYRLRRLFRQQAVDFCVIRLGAFPLGIYLAGRIPCAFAVKTLSDPHWQNWLTGIGGRLVRLLSPVSRAMTRSILRRAAVIDACTSELKEQNEQVYGLPGKLHVIGNATNTKRFAPGDLAAARCRLGLQQFDPILGFMGGRGNERGGFQMVQVAARLVKDFPRLGVAVVSRHGQAALQQLAGDLGIQANSHLPGEVPYELAADYLNSFDVCFSLEPPERFKQTGTSAQKLRQYLACGKPVVTCASDPGILAQPLVEYISPTDVDNIDVIERATRRLLAASAATKQAHAASAVRYAAENLSTHAVLNARIALWRSALEAQSPVSAARQASPSPDRTKVAA
jgi:glycosyltransferase involved in cell wall biosynthesis